MNQLSPEALAQIAQALNLRTDIARAILPIALANLQTLDRKNLDYGSHNLTRFGTHGIVVRMTDKMERAINLSRPDGDVVLTHNEPLRDSLLDLSNYGLIGYVMEARLWPAIKS